MLTLQQTLAQITIVIHNDCYHIRIVDRWHFTSGFNDFRKFNSRIFTIGKIFGLNGKTSYTISIQITIVKGV